MGTRQEETSVVDRTKENERGAPSRSFADGSFVVHVPLNGNVRHSRSVKAILREIREAVADMGSPRAGSPSR
jgi:hypothetical protein